MKSSFKFFLIIFIYTSFLVNFLSAEGDNDLQFSDDDLQVQTRDSLYKRLRKYGVPPDVAQLYLPTEVKGDKTYDKERNKNDGASFFDPWSIVWYIGSFGALITFFLVISCSEWCCLKRRTIAAQRRATVPTQLCTNHIQIPTRVIETPPPAYHLFAPPTYDETIVCANEKTKFDIFVVPVHQTKNEPNFSPV